MTLSAVHEYSVLNEDEQRWLAFTSSEPHISTRTLDRLLALLHGGLNLENLPRSHAALLAKLRATEEYSDMVHAPQRPSNNVSHTVYLTHTLSHSSLSHSQVSHLSHLSLSPLSYTVTSLHMHSRPHTLVSGALVSLSLAVSLTPTPVTHVSLMLTSLMLTSLSTKHASPTLRALH